MKKLTVVEIVALGAAAGVTVFTMLRAGGWSLDLGMIAFIVWAISPLICFAAAIRGLTKLSSIRYIPLVGAVAAVLMLAFTVYVYWNFENDTSSTASLIFLVVPIYLYIGGFFFLTVGLVTGWLLGKFGKSAT